MLVLRLLHVRMLFFHQSPQTLPHSDVRCHVTFMSIRSNGVHAIAVSLVVMSYYSFVDHDSHVRLCAAVVAASPPIVCAFCVWLRSVTLSLR